MQKKILFVLCAAASLPALQPALISASQAGAGSRRGWSLRSPPESGEQNVPAAPELRTALPRAAPREGRRLGRCGHLGCRHRRGCARSWGPRMGGSKPVPAGWGLREKDTHRDSERQRDVHRQRQARLRAEGKKTSTFPPGSIRPPSPGTEEDRNGLSPALEWGSEGSFQPPAPQGSGREPGPPLPGLVPHLPLKAE